MIIRLVSALLTISLLAACNPSAVSTSDATLRFNEIEVINTSREQVHDFKIKVQSNDRVFKCGSVIAGGYCSYGFHVRPYQGNSITVSWVNEHEAISVGPLVIPIPTSFTEEVYKVVFEFEHADRFDVYFKPQEKQRSDNL